MDDKTVLISGAGIAGPTLAYWLARHGFRPTVVELAPGVRSSGSPVDVRGPAVAVAERMGIARRLREAGTDVTDLWFVNAEGRRTGGLSLGALPGAAAGGRDVEIGRGDLAAILQETSRDHAEFLFGDSIATIDQDEHGVDVTFRHAPPRRFGLVIGADGQHSTVRRQVFGPESRFVAHAGLYVATLPLGGAPAPHPRTVVAHNTPGRMVAVHPRRGDSLAFFAYRAAPVPDFDHRDADAHKRLLGDAYAGGGWRIPELLERVRTTEELYFDAVSRVRMDRWSHGRTALLGDAASSVSLFGDGSTLAMAGAYTLAAELAASPEDHAGAFRRYEERHRRLVDPKQRGVERAAAMLVPATRAGIVARNLASRVWSAAAEKRGTEKQLAPGPRGLLRWGRSRRPVGNHQCVIDPEVSSLMTVIAQGAARTQKTINVTSVVSG
ncbi:FAD-dependent monooxygenase [Streptomyces sp. NPDC059874]|uniref:FAD-dependent monooxygenase n=1 Tax=Streptomyces sp. NPDC059874 TaxID=3346983 RepID=UPI00365834C3